MKLATLKDSTRDGQLVVVSKDLTRCSEVGHIARTLQAALDDWSHTAPRLARVAEGLETGAQPTMRFHEHDATSPLPRAFQWAVGFQNDSGGPMIQQGGSDGFLCPRDAIQLADRAWGLESQGGIAVIIDDVPLGATREQARDAIRLVMLVNDLSLTNVKSGDYQSRPAASFSPVAVTPDELGDALTGGKLDLPLKLELNGKPLNGASTGAGTLFDFAELIVAAARTRRLSAGTIIGARPAAHGSSLKSGDTIRIAMKDKAGHSIFGAIEQVVRG